jgi:hypothetical protein
MKNYDAWSVGENAAASVDSDDRDTMPNSSNQCRQSKAVLSMPHGEKNVILSLHNDYYKQVMWSHYRILGKTRDAEYEHQVGLMVLGILKDKLSKNQGKFYKQVGCGNSCRNLEEIDEEMALASKLMNVVKCGNGS